MVDAVLVLRELLVEIEVVVVMIVGTTMAVLRVIMRVLAAMWVQR